SSLYGSKSKLDFILMYLKENPNQYYHGEMFDMSQSKVSEWVSYLLPALEASLAKMKVMPQSGYCYRQRDKEVDYLLVDVTERQVVRDVDPDNQ
ncbi:transposase family protein, partial [Reichenbachiella sp. MALMAid0571]|uniref:transposase family protein n=1 Tax=Reichenbachiella sp. MALMAid0571 TaxID=3143939 RepID=UPI0032DEEE6E